MNNVTLVELLLAKDIENKLIKIAADLSPMIEINDTKIIDVDFQDEGYFDSFQLIEFIRRLEVSFGINLSADIILSNEFRTFRGIAGIIEKWQYD